MNILRTCRERDVPSSHAHPHMSHAPHHSHGSTPSSGSRSKAPSLDRQITVQVQYSTVHFSTVQYSTDHRAGRGVSPRGLRALRPRQEGDSLPRETRKGEVETENSDFT